MCFRPYLRLWRPQISLRKIYGNKKYSPNISQYKDFTHYAQAKNQKIVMSRSSQYSKRKIFVFKSFLSWERCRFKINQNHISVGNSSIDCVRSLMGQFLLKSIWMNHRQAQGHLQNGQEGSCKNKNFFCLKRYKNSALI